jgi:hypothetical protein
MLKLNRHWLTLIRWLYSLPVAGAIVYVTLYGHDLNPIWGLWLSPNGNYWHTVDGYPQHRCKASELRKAYHDYRMKYIDAPLIQACKLRGNREES